MITNPALLVIDIQNDFCSEQGMLSKSGKDISAIQRMVYTLKRYLKHIHELRIPIAYIQSNYDLKYLPGNISKVYQKNGLVNLCRSNSWGGDFYQIKPTTNIFIKHRYDAFTNKKFEKWLMENKIKSLILTGCQTDVCVDSTARSGFMKGYEIVAIKDCLASLDNSEHERTLKHMKKYYNALIRDSAPLKRCKDVQH